MSVCIFQSALPKRISDVLNDAYACSDWELVESVYRQCSEIANDAGGAYMPDKLVSFLAEALWRVSSSYFNREETFILHALAVLGMVEGQETLTSQVLRDLYRDERYERFARYAPRAPGKRRRPKPFESLIETARRLRDANALADACSTTETTGILGGSASYGRFFNVCGSHDGRQASDLDFMIVLPEYADLDDTVEAIRHLGAASPKSLDNLARRAAIFNSNGLDDSRTIFSHKLDLWLHKEDPVMAWAGLPGTYNLSLHFLSRSVLDYLLVEDSTKLMADRAGHHRTVNDYREKAVSREDHQRSFSGRNQRLPLPTEDVEGGVIRKSRVFVIDLEDRYYPGMFQNMLLPRFDYRWDDARIERQLQVFKWKIIERIRYERRMRPHEFLRVSLAHTRSEVFAPHVLDMIDTGLTSA
jgi:hypothetical protein